MSTPLPQWHAPKGLMPTTSITLTLDWAAVQWALRLAQAYQESHQPQPDSPDAEEPFSPQECNRALLHSLDAVIAYVSPPRVQSSAAQTAPDGTGVIVPFRRRQEKGGQSQ